LYEKGSVFICTHFFPWTFVFASCPHMLLKLPAWIHYINKACIVYTMTRRIYYGTAGGIIILIEVKYWQRSIRHVSYVKYVYMLVKYYWLLRASGFFNLLCFYFYHWIHFCVCCCCSVEKKKINHHSYFCLLQPTNQPTTLSRSYSWKLHHGTIYALIAQQCVCISALQLASHARAIIHQLSINHYSAQLAFK